MSRIEDYMSQGNRGRKVENKYAFLYDIDYYRSISNAKKELFKSMHRYIDTFTQNAEVSHLTGDNTAIIQSQTSEGYRCLIRFNLLSVEDYDYDSYFSPNNSQYITDEEFNRRLNKYSRVGSQYIANIVLTFKDRDLNNYPVQVFYSEDGHAFVDEVVADLISKTDEADLGRKLATVARLPRYGYTSSDSTTNKVLKTRYERGLNKELYQVRNGKLYNSKPLNTNEEQYTKRLSLFDIFKRRR